MLVQLFGGGVYPTRYYSDTWALDLDLPLAIPNCTPPSWNTLLAQSDNIVRGTSTDQKPNFGTPDLKLLCPASLALVKNSNTDSVVKDAANSTSNNTVTIRVHRSLLAQRCSFFSALSSFAEATQPELTLPETPAPAVRVVLNYLYTGELRWEATEYGSIGSMGDNANERKSEVHVSHGQKNERNRPGVEHPVEFNCDKDASLDDNVNLLSDGLELAQAVLHLAGLWSLDHLKHLAEMDILRAFSQMPSEDDDHKGRNDVEALSTNPPEPQGQLDMHQHPSVLSTRADSHVNESSHISQNSERLRVPVEHAVQLLELADCLQCPLLKEHALHSLKRHGAVLTDDRIVRLKASTESWPSKSDAQLGDKLALELRRYLESLF